MPRRHAFAPSILLLVASLTATAFADPAKLAVTKGDGQVAVTVDGQPFTSYVHKPFPGGLRKPILYPVFGPDQAPMTRNFPMRKDVPGEASDHPHHQSIWFTHGHVNGQNFWMDTDKAGSIRTQGTPTVVTNSIPGADPQDHAWILAKNEWIAVDGKTVVCTDDTVIRCGVHADGTRAIDYVVTIHAGDRDVTFGDDKEGTFGIRTHAGLQLTPVKKGDKATGSAVNSEGVKGKDIWGKRASWVAYWGPVPSAVEGAATGRRTYGMAMFDHPTNLRHPTTWHARDYGLVAANPFGVAEFEKKPKGTGDFTIKAGQSRTFAYQLLFFRGDAAQAKVKERYETWAKQPVVTKPEPAKAAP